ncbi:MAG TPA: hypothetical protein VF323_08960 [Candidatus Limnocylindrales bacterium]
MATGIAGAGFRGVAVPVTGEAMAPLDGAVLETARGGELVGAGLPTPAEAEAEAEAEAGADAEADAAASETLGLAGETLGLAGTGLDVAAAAEGWTAPAEPRLPEPTKVSTSTPAVSTARSRRKPAIAPRRDHRRPDGDMRQAYTALAPHRHATAATGIVVPP